MVFSQRAKSHDARFQAAGPHPVRVGGIIDGSGDNRVTPVDAGTRWVTRAGALIIGRCMRTGSVGSARPPAEARSDPPIATREEIQTRFQT